MKKNFYLAALAGFALAACDGPVERSSDASEGRIPADTKTPQTASTPATSPPSNAPQAPNQPVLGGDKIEVVGLSSNFSDLKITDDGGRGLMFRGGVPGQLYTFRLKRNGKILEIERGCGGQLEAGSVVLDGVFYAFVSFADAGNSDDFFFNCKLDSSDFVTSITFEQFAKLPPNATPLGDFHETSQSFFYNTGTFYSVVDARAGHGLLLAETSHPAGNPDRVGFDIRRKAEWSGGAIPFQPTIGFVVGDPKIVGNDVPRSLHINGDGSFYLVVESSQVYFDGKADSARFFVLKYRSDGVLDRRFARNGVLDVTPDQGWKPKISAKTDASGRLLVLTTTCESANCGSVLRRFLPDGSLDKGFGKGGMVKDIPKLPDLRTYDVRLIGDAKDLIFVNHYWSEYAWGQSISVLDKNGSILFQKKIALTPPGSACNGSLADAVLDANRKLTFLGYCSSGELFVSKYLPDGTLDLSFGSNGFALASMNSCKGTSCVPDPRARLALGVMGEISVVTPYSFDPIKFHGRGTNATLGERAYVLSSNGSLMTVKEIAGFDRTSCNLERDAARVMWAGFTPSGGLDTLFATGGISHCIGNDPGGAGYWTKL